MTHTLVVIRHAKSDWDVDAADRDRPLAKRGRRQAPYAGRWIAEQGIVLDLAVVSPAARARQTWALVSAELDVPPPMQVEEAAYTFDGDDLFAVVGALPESARAVALVGHNPAVEEFVETVTGRYAALPTSAIAVLEVPEWGSVGPGTGRLMANLRPVDGASARAAGRRWRPGSARPP
jgi:phosphohistidine phosphatase